MCEGGHIANESGPFRVLRGQSIGLWRILKSWMPAFEITPKLLVEDARANLQKAVGTDGRPTHLLPLDEPLAHDLVTADSTNPVAMGSPWRWRSA